jgi:hypothetical protein
MEGVNVRYIVSTYVNITLYHPVQLLYANNNKKDLSQEKRMVPQTRMKQSESIFNFP